MAAMNLYDATVPIFTKFLGNLEKWIDKGVAYAEQKKFDPQILMDARLAPDQYAFRQQVQTACDVAKFACAKMTGKEAPSHADTEVTVAEVRARIRTVLDYIATFSRDDFNGAEERRVSHTWMQGKGMRGGDYLDHFALPNFHFHLTLAYAILRHNGVDLGIMDHMGSLPFAD
jgi:uncharacterized protein